MAARVSPCARLQDGGSLFSSSLEAAGRSPGGRLCRAGEVSSGVGPPRCGQKEPEPARGGRGLKRVGADRWVRAGMSCGLSASRHAALRAEGARVGPPLREGGGCERAAGGKRF